MYDYFESESGDRTLPSEGGPYIPDASECMRCGLCVSRCPTFKLFQTHQETPRARLRTIDKILVAGETVGDEERVHLDNCLQCLACEAVCPARMAYSELFNSAQARLTEKRRSGLAASAAFKIIESKALRRVLLPLIAAYIASGLQTLLRRSGILARLNLAEADALSTKPALSELAVFYPALRESLGKVGLFTGCVSDHFDRKTLQSAIVLITAIGYDVLIPREQTCCGAIHQHNGRQDTASDLFRRNILVFNVLDVDAVIFTSTGCGAMLSEYPQDDRDGLEFQARLCDINDFLQRHWPENLSLKAVVSRVAVHEPCSQRNSLKNQHSVYALLQKIPGLTIEPLTDNHLCCGSGGAYMLTHPENAERLRDMKRQAIESAAPDVVVSANFGCAMYLNAATPDTAVKVVHPLKLLADCLYAHC